MLLRRPDKALAAIRHCGPPGGAAFARPTVQPLDIERPGIIPAFFIGVSERLMRRFRLVLLRTLEAVGQLVFLDVQLDRHLTTVYQ